MGLLAIYKNNAWHPIC